MRRYMRLSILAIGIALVTAATLWLLLPQSTGHSKTMDNTIQISLLQQGADVVRLSPLPIEGGGGVGGLRMYDAGPYAKGVDPVVVLKDPYHPITFPVFDHLSLYEDGSDGRGVFGIEFYLRLPAQPRSYSETRAWAEYDDAVRKIVQETIDRINAAHWQRWTMFDTPRLSGRDTIAFVPGYRNRGYVADGQYMWGIDPSYRMTQEDWANLSRKGAMWYWIKDGASLILRYDESSRDPPILFDSLKVTIQAPGSIAGEFYGDTNLKARQSVMLRMLGERKQEEAAARAAGAKILEDYKDYPLGGVTVPDTNR